MNREEFHKRYQYNNRNNRIGGGAFGTVYKAYDRRLDREVAIKVQEVSYINEKEFSLQVEYDAIKALDDHPNIANYEKIHRFEDGPGLYDYAIMQFYPLGNLSTYLKKNTISHEQKSKILVQILQGIAYLHHNRVVHRDIKPGNILVVERPNEGIIPKITDFGLSKLAEINDEHSLFQNSFAGGTVEYSSPEQLKGSNIKFNTDLWSFGVIIFEVFSGKTVFNVEGYGDGSAGKQGEIIQQILKKDIQAELEKLPSDWQKIAKLCFERDQNKRPSTGKELLKEISKEYYNPQEDTFLKKEPEFKSTAVENEDTVTRILEDNFGEDDTDTQILEGQFGVEQKTSLPDEKVKNKKPLLIGLGAAALLALILFGFIQFSGGSTPQYAAMVSLNGRTGYIDTDGKTIIAPTFQAGLYFSEGLAPVKTATGWNYINIEGNKVIEQDFLLATPFSDGLALVKNTEGWFYIKKSGERAFDGVFQMAKLFSDGLAPVKTSEGWAYINKSGEKISKEVYEDAKSYSNGLAAVKKQEKWGFIDINGDEVIGFNYLAANDFAENAIAVQFNDGKWKFIDKDDSVLFEGSFDRAEHFSEGLAAVRQNGKWGYVDKNGNTVIDYKYEDTGAFVDGVAPVKNQSKWGFIDNQGNEHINLKYDRVDNYKRINQTL